MKKYLYLATTFALLMFLATKSVTAAETVAFDSTSNYLGGCQLTNKSEWELDKDIEVTKFQIWYSWQEGETELPVTVYKDGDEFAKFIAVRSECDPYQKQWCNANYEIGKTFPKAKYTTEIAESRQCLRPGGTATVRLYAEGNTVSTQEAVPAPPVTSTGNTPTTTKATQSCQCKSCTSKIIIAIGGGFLAALAAISILKNGSSGKKSES